MKCEDKQLALLDYRTTPMDSFNMSQAQLLMGRRPRNTLLASQDLLSRQHMTSGKYNSTSTHRKHSDIWMWVKKSPMRRKTTYMVTRAFLVQTGPKIFQRRTFISLQDMHMVHLHIVGVNGNCSFCKGMETMMLSWKFLQHKLWCLHQC